MSGQINFFAELFSPPSGAPDSIKGKLSGSTHLRDVFLKTFNEIKTVQSDKLSTASTVEGTEFALDASVSLTNPDLAETTLLNSGAASDPRQSGGMPAENVQDAPSRSASSNAVATNTLAGTAVHDLTNGSTNQKADFLQGITHNSDVANGTSQIEPVESIAPKQAAFGDVASSDLVAEGKIVKPELAQGLVLKTDTLPEIDAPQIHTRDTTSSFSGINDTQTAPSQPGFASRPSNMQIPATTPFSQSAAAVLNPKLHEPTKTPSKTVAPASPGDIQAGQSNRLTPSQPGSALRPSNVQIPATMPFPQSAAAVLTSPASETKFTANTAEPSGKLPVDTRPVSTAPHAEPSLINIAREPATATAASVYTDGLPVAPLQPGNAHRPSHVQLPADSPFPQSAAAALTSNAEVPAPSSKSSGVITPVSEPPISGTTASISEGATTFTQIQISDEGVIDKAVTSSSDSLLVPSQPGPALRPSHVHIPAVSPAPQSAAAVLTAQVSDIPNILSESLSAEDGARQIKIQLDPPELGRVSIDFKFEGNVLQNVVVTGETPEAMRRLRLMHFELVQTLENFGFSGQELDFSQREDQHRTFSESQDYYQDMISVEQEDVEFPADAAIAGTAQMVEAEGLNLKL